MSLWYRCNTDLAVPEIPHFNLSVPAVAGTYEYYVTKPSTCWQPVTCCGAAAAAPTEDTRYRNYYKSMIDGIYLNIYSCKQVKSAYNDAIKEAKEEKMKKYNMTEEQYVDYLERNGLSKDKLYDVPDLKYPNNCTLPHDDEGNHFVYNWCNPSSCQHSSHSCQHSNHSCQHVKHSCHSHGHSHSHGHGHGHSCCHH